MNTLFSHREGGQFVPRGGGDGRGRGVRGGGRQLDRNMAALTLFSCWDFYFHFFPPTKEKKLCRDPSPIEYTAHGLNKKKLKALRPTKSRWECYVYITAPWILNGPLLSLPPQMTHVFSMLSFFSIFDGIKKWKKSEHKETLSSYKNLNNY